MPEPDVAHRKEVAQSLKEFVFYAMWTRFHLDCLFKSLQNDRRLYPGILAEIVDGLRAAVNAYAWVRRAIDLRSAPGEEELNFLTWDEEDQALLDEANRDPILEV